MQHLYEWRGVTIHDLRKRVASLPVEPEYNFTIRPSFGEVVSRLNILLNLANQGPLRLAFDTETFKQKFIACIGIAWSTRDAINIPFMCREHPQGYWSLDEELEITLKLTALLEHPNVQAIWQNGLYDLQYTAHHWCCAPEPYMDTMLAHHVCWAGLPKALDFQASMYADYYQYWKHEGKEVDTHETDEQNWIYNCKDACYTFECSFAIEATLEKLGLKEQNAFQHSLFMPVLQMMLRGVRIDKKIRSELDLDLQQAMSEREQYFEDVLGHPLNPRSNPQMRKLFYEDFGLPIQRARKTGSPTLNDQALTRLAVREPVVRPLIDRIQEYRSAGTVLSGIVRSSLDPDGRMRCSFTIPGTETYRFSSSENAFGRGTNLQNVTAGSEEEDEGLTMPNARRLFVPDPGHVMIEADLEGADAQVVAWDAGDEVLKQMFHERVQLHLENMKIVYPGAKLVKSSSPDSPYHKTKQFVHMTNYGAGARKIAETLGMTVHEADLRRNRWLGAHPAIKQWHNSILEQLQVKRFVKNAYGFRRYYFDRIEGLLPEALAWIPQSTVAITINKGLVNVDRELPRVQLLLQVHDSLVMQAPSGSFPAIIPEIERLLSVTIPYDDPLVIPVACKYSYRSWGDCEPYKETNDERRNAAVS